MFQTILNRNFRFILSFGLLFSISIGMHSQNMEDLKKSKEDLQKKIQWTNSLLSKNKKSTSTSFHQLEVVRSKIILETDLIENLSAEISALDIKISELEIKQMETEAEIDNIKEEYAKLVYTSWKMSKAGKQFHYVLAGYDLGMVYRRFRYIISFNNYRQKQAELLEEKRIELDNLVLEAKNSKVYKEGLIDSKGKMVSQLNVTQRQKEGVIANLKREQKDLKKQLRQQQTKIDELEKFIQEIIRKQIEESKKASNTNEFGLTPEQKLLGSNFDGNKGRLPWPLKQGVIVQRFGNYTPEGLNKVSLKSNGVEFQTSNGSIARSVFEGVVVGVYALPGYNTGVIVQHGNYFSFYANLDKVFVKQGQKVSVKQDIGSIYFDKSTQKCILHFELYQDKVALNPQYWLSK